MHGDGAVTLNEKYSACTTRSSSKTPPARLSAHFLTFTSPLGSAFSSTCIRWRSNASSWSVEIKATYVLPPTAKRQTLNYLRSTNLEVALILHFGPEPKFYRLVHSNK